MIDLLHGQSKSKNQKDLNMGGSKENHRNKQRVDHCARLFNLFVTTSTGRCLATTHAAEQTCGVVGPANRECVILQL